MRKSRIITKRIITADGRVIAEACSSAFSQDSDSSEIYQTVEVGSDEDGVWSHSVASSSSSSSGSSTAKNR